MKRISAFDAVRIFLEEVEREMDSLKRNPDRVAKVKECCDCIDVLAKKMGDEDVSVKVDIEPKELNMIVTLNCFTLEASGKTREFYTLLEGADEIKVSWVNAETVGVSFVFGGIWEQ